MLEIGGLGAFPYVALGIECHDDGGKCCKMSKCSLPNENPRKMLLVFQGKYAIIYSELLYCCRERVWLCYCIGLIRWGEVGSGY